MQTKLQSAVESATNTTVGYFVALITQLLMFPFFNIHVEFHENLIMTGIFTFVSMIRSYIIRRWFDKRNK